MLKGHTSVVMAVAVFQNGDIVTGSYCTAIILNTDGEQKQVLKGHTDWVNAVAVLPNGDIITGSKGRTAII